MLQRDDDGVVSWLEVKRAKGRLRGSAMQSDQGSCVADWVGCESKLRGVPDAIPHTERGDALALAVPRSQIDEPRNLFPA